MAGNFDYKNEISEEIFLAVLFEDITFCSIITKSVTIM